MTPPFPNFFYFGTPKSGSGTITELLAAHPEVFASRPKELNFFNRDSRFSRGTSWYREAHFGDHAGEPVICDNSIGYSAGDPDATMERIVGTVGRDFRILLTIRNPINRAYSNYCMARYKGQIESLDFLDAVRSGMEIGGLYNSNELQIALDQQKYYSDDRSMAIFRHATYLVPGQCARLVKLCRSAVGNENVLILFTQDLATDLAGEMRKLTDFLEIEPTVVDNEIRRNEATALRYPWLRKFYNQIMSFTLARRAYNSLGLEARKGLRRKLLSWNYRRNDSVPDLDPEAKKLLLDYYRDEIDELQKLTSRNLCQWQTL